MEKPILHLLKAEHLPASIAAVREQATARSARALSAISLLPPETSPQQLIAQLEYSLALLGQPSPASEYTSADIAHLPEDRYEEHDLFFGAVRVQGKGTETLTRTLLEAYRGHLSDLLRAPEPFAREQQQLLGGAFLASFDLLRAHHAPAADTTPTDLADPVEVVPAKVDAAIRWRLGHQVFFALIQSLIVAVSCATEAAERASHTEAAQLLDTATVVMLGSAASLRYAGAFSPVAYAHAVRPSMMPPALKPKFSGLQLRDHRYLIKALGSLRAVIESADEGVRRSYLAFVAAMSKVYDEHKLVCAHFGGATEPSLRMKAAADMSAVDALERLKRGRLRAAGY